MKSRYGLWILSICCIGLAGCANWQNRVNNTDGPGSAASLSAAPAGSTSPMFAAPGTSFNEPPPPVPPSPTSDPSMTIGPLGAPPPQRLDLSAAEAPASAPARMYNLDSTKAPAKPKQSASVSKPATKTNTITKLASKAKPASSSSSASASKPKESAISRLSAKSSTKTADSETLPKPDAVASKPAAPDSEPASTVDTTFLAQPVRKGSSSEDSSKGPQSNAIPSDNKLLYGKSQPAIYPVSNPAVTEPVDTTQFS